MARTEQEIYDAMLVDKTAESDLDELTSNSVTAIWRLILWVCAKAIHVVETLWDSFKTEVEELALTGNEGTIPWYQALALAFTYDSVAIIARAAVVESNKLIFKVSKDNAGTLVPLTGDEVTAFETYLNKKKFAGTKTTVLSLNADLLRMTGTFYYDGQYDPAVVKADVDSKIAAYLKGLEYNGYLYAMKLQDVFQGATGYYDLDIETLEATTAADISWIAVGRRYNPLAGYIALDSPVSDMLTFTPVTDVQS